MIKFALKNGYAVRNGKNVAVYRGTEYFATHYFTSIVKAKTFTRTLRKVVKMAKVERQDFYALLKGSSIIFNNGASKTF